MELWLVAQLQLFINFQYDMYLVMIIYFAGYSNSLGRESLSHNLNIMLEHK